MSIALTAAFYRISSDYQFATVHPSTHAHAHSAFVPLEWIFLILLQSRNHLPKQPAVRLHVIVSPIPTKPRLLFYAQTLKLSIIDQSRNSNYLFISTVVALAPKH